MTIQEISSLITIFALITAGAWTWYRFGISREQYAKLQFDLTLKQLGESRDKIIIELAANITNKGIARQYIRHFRFNILTFDDDMPFDLSDLRIEKRLKFSEMDKGLRWVSSEHPAFVDGGISQDFTYVTAVDKNVRFVMIYAKFDNLTKRFGKDRSEHYRISRTFAIKEQKS
jgi:hypothetical protein